MGKLTELKIDGVTHQLGFNFNDLVDAESVTGCNLMQALERATSDLTATQLRALLYTMLVPPKTAPPDPQELLRFVGDLLRVDTVTSVRCAIAEALARAINDDVGDQVRDELHEQFSDRIAQESRVAKAPSASSSASTGAKTNVNGAPDVPSAAAAPSSATAAQPVATDGA